MRLFLLLVFIKNASIAVCRIPTATLFLHMIQSCKLTKYNTWVLICTHLLNARLVHHFCYEQLMIRLVDLLHLSHEPPCFSFWPFGDDFSCHQSQQYQCLTGLKCSFLLLVSFPCLLENTPNTFSLQSHQSSF